MARSTVAVRFTGDTADLKRSLDGIDNKLKATGSKLASFGKTAAIGFAGLAAGGAVLAKGFVDAAIESQKVTKQTEAVIKSMGGASKISAKEVAELSTALSLKSGVDDELIQSGENVLLTFGNVRNELGEGNDIFNRATAAALDMSVALGTDMSSASMQLGKALNDPVEGLSKLKRSGIQFSDQQEEQIRLMAEAGDTAGAQKVMLAELERQFGGSAAAQATASDKLKVAWGNLQEELGAKLLPAIEKLSTWAAAKLPAAMAMAERAFARVKPVVEDVVAVVREHWPEIQETIEKVVDHVRTVIGGFVDVATTLWENFGNNVLELIQRVWPRIQQIIEGAMKIIQGVIKTVTSLIKGDWSGVWEGIKQVVSGVWTAIQGIVGGALEVLRSAIGVALEVIGSIFKSAWEGIKSAAQTAVRGIVDVFLGMAESVVGAAAAAFSWVPGLGPKLREAKEAIERFRDDANAALGGINDKTVTIKFVRNDFIGPLPAGVSRLPASFVGPVQEGRNAQGTSNWRGGLSWVGEHGPELLNLPAGSQVIPHGRSMAMAGAGGEPIHVTVQLDGRVLGEVLANRAAVDNRNRAR